LREAASSREPDQWQVEQKSQAPQLLGFARCSGEVKVLAGLPHRGQTWEVWRGCCHSRRMPVKKHLYLRMRHNAPRTCELFRQLRQRPFVWRPRPADFMVFWLVATFPMLFLQTSLLAFPESTRKRLWMQEIFLLRKRQKTMDICTFLATVSYPTEYIHIPIYIRSSKILLEECMKK
jgi:hypothetical protein